MAFTRSKVLVASVAVIFLLNCAVAVDVKSSQLWEVSNYENEIQYTFMDVYGDQLFAAGSGPEGGMVTYASLGENGISSPFTYNLNVPSFQGCGNGRSGVLSSPQYSDRIYSSWTCSKGDENSSTEWFIGYSDKDGSNPYYLSLYPNSNSALAFSLGTVFLEDHFITVMNDQFQVESAIIIADGELSTPIVLKGSSNLNIQALAAYGPDKAIVTGSWANSVYGCSYVAIIDTKGNIISQKVINTSVNTVTHVVANEEFIVMTMMTNENIALVLDSSTLEPLYMANDNQGFGNFTVAGDGDDILVMWGSSDFPTQVWKTTRSGLVPYFQFSHKLFSQGLNYSVGAATISGSSLLTMGPATHSSNMSGGVGFVIFDLDAPNGEGFSQPPALSSTQVEVYNPPVPPSWNMVSQLPNHFAMGYHRTNFMDSTPSKFVSDDVVENVDQGTRFLAQCGEFSGVLTSSHPSKEF